VKRVAQSEFDLLTVARALVGQVGAEAVEPLLRQPRAVGPKLGPTAMGLLKRTLAKGAVLELCRRGGWRPAAHLEEMEVVTGRLWQRRQPPELRFSSVTVELLRWLAASPLAMDAECKPLKVKGRVQLGDELVLYLACDLAERCCCCAPLARTPLFRSSSLVWLGFFEPLARRAPLRADGLDRALGQLVGERAVLLEALQADLARRWIAAERRKGQLTQPAQMIALGESQRALVEALCAALDRHQRRDLAGFLLEAAGALLRHRPEPSRWVAVLAPGGALAERQRAFRAAGALLESLGQLGRWAEEAQGVRFFDDEYEASQLLLKQWGQVGAQGLAHAQELVQRMQALDAAVSAQGAAQSEVTP
jgi:hypothetical protein